MSKFNAAIGFVELMKKNPEDFNAKVDCGRDHEIYTVSFKYRAVSISIDVHGGMFRVVSSKDGSINFVGDLDKRAVVEFAKERIEQDKVQALIDKDNSLINVMIDYYEKR